MLKNTNKFSKLSILLIIIFLLFLSAEFSFARELEVPLPGLEESPTLPEYIKYIFGFAMGIGGVMGVIGLIIGGFYLIIAAGNPTKISEAKKTILGGIFGMVLLLSSFIILKTINPELKELKLPELSLVPGLYLGIKGESQPTRPSPRMFPDTSKLESQYGAPYDIIRWPEMIPGCSPEEDGEEDGKCINCDPEKEKGVYTVYSFEDSDFEELTKTHYRLSCGSVTDIQGKAFWIVKETPGVYFYPYADQKVEISEGIRGIPMPYLLNIPARNMNKLIGSIRIVNGPNSHNGPFYGVILHGGLDYIGTYEHFRFSQETGSIKKYNVDYPGSVRSITIYKWVGYKIVSGEDDSITLDFASAGDGVKFWSHPQWTGGYYHVKEEEIEGIQMIFLDEDKTPYNYTGTKIPEDERKECKWVKHDCLGSIQILGKYLVLFKTKSLYSQRFPISKKLVDEANLKYDTRMGSKNFKVDQINHYPSEIEKVLIIPLAEKL